MVEEAAWRRRFRAPRVNLPTWADNAPDRLIYGSNESGTWELYSWDRASDEKRQVTERQRIEAIMDELTRLVTDLRSRYPKRWEA